MEGHDSPSLWIQLLHRLLVYLAIVIGSTLFPYCLLAIDEKLLPNCALLQYLAAQRLGNGVRFSSFLSAQVGNGEESENKGEEGFWRESILASLNKSLETKADVK